MAQVYSFTDQNGETRLFAEIHPDPAGTPFNGGTITEGLTIADPDGAEDQLTITGVGSGGAKLINATAVHTAFVVDSDGSITFSSDDTAGLSILGTGNTGASIALATDNPNRASLNVGTSLGLELTAHGNSTAGLQVRDSAFADIFRANVLGIVIALHAAPADDDLAAGECALWFDQTNAAAKLMIKAKQADGTVKTGFVAVVT